MKEIDKKRPILILIAVAIALLSFFGASRVATSMDFHANSIATLEEKKTTVLELTAAAAASSAAITLLPGDTATPIADKLADLSTHFLIVLCAIFLEKYLLTLTGYAAFNLLIPLACLLYIIHLFFGMDILKSLGRKLFLFGLVIVLVIPVSIQLSNLIESTYQTSIQNTIEDAKDAAQEAQKEEGSDEENDSLFSWIGNGISNVTSGITEKVGGIINNFLEALAVMLITSCVIPILVLLFFICLVKATFSLNLPVSYGAAFQRAKNTRKSFKEKETDAEKKDHVNLP